MQHLFWLLSLFFWLGWGIRGAATATILSQFAGMIWVLSHFMQEKSYIRFKKGIIQIKGNGIVENIFSIGMSPFLDECLRFGHCHYIQQEPAALRGRIWLSAHTAY